MSERLNSEYDERRSEILLLRIGGAPADSAAAWISEVNRAEREGRPVPGWPDLERIAPSLQTQAVDADLVPGRYPSSNLQDDDYLTAIAANRRAELNRARAAQREQALRDSLREVLDRVDSLMGPDGRGVYVRARAALAARPEPPQLIVDAVATTVAALDVRAVLDAVRRRHLHPVTEADATDAAVGDALNDAERSLIAALHEYSQAETKSPR